MKIQELSLQQFIEISKCKLIDISSLRRMGNDKETKNEDITYCGPSLFHYCIQTIKTQPHLVNDYNQVDPRCFLKAKLFLDNFSICIFDTLFKLDPIHLNLKYESIKYFKSLLCPYHNYEIALLNFSIPTDRIYDLAIGRKKNKSGYSIAATEVVDKYSSLPFSVKEEISKIRNNFKESYPRKKDLWIPFEYFHNTIPLEMVEAIYRKNLEITQARRALDGKKAGTQVYRSFFSKIRHEPEQRFEGKVNEAKREMESLTDYYHPILDYGSGINFTDAKQQVDLSTYLYNFDKWVSKINKRVRKKAVKDFPDFDFIEKIKFRDQVVHPKDPKHKVIFTMLNNHPMIRKSSDKYLYRMGIMTSIYKEHFLDRWEQGYEDNNKKNNAINCQKRRMREEQREIEAVEAELSSQR